VQTPAPRPYIVLLARSITSSSVLNFIIDITGPKIYKINRYKFFQSISGLKFSEIQNINCDTNHETQEVFERTVWQLCQLAATTIAADYETVRTKAWHRNSSSQLHQEANLDKASILQQQLASQCKVSYNTRRHYFLCYWNCRIIIPNIFWLEFAPAFFVSLHL
jgi:hypothetical protein